MLRSTFIYRTMTTCCFIFITVLAWSQEMAFQVPLNKQVELSTQIVEGKVISKKSFWDVNQNEIYTVNIIKVYKVFKGVSSKTIEVITKGGIVDLNAQVVSHSLQLHPGDLGVFMLSNINATNLITKGSNLPTYKSVTAAQGFFKYNLKEDKVVNTFSISVGIANNFYGQITQNTKINIIEVEQLDVQEMVSQETLNRTTTSKSPAVIISFWTTDNSAGTKSILTINGSGFGTTQGTVAFSNANYGGALHTNTLDNQIVNWSDTEIQVEIPDEAGTGTIKVNSTSNGSVISTENLIIDYSQINLAYDIGSGDNDYQTQNVDLDGEGGITWTINEGFYNSEAMTPFEEAISTWSCESGINWEVGPTTTSSTLDSYDGVNLVTMASLGAGILGQTFSAYSACFEGGEIKWYVTDTDMIYNSNINWNYTVSAPAFDEVDFESVSVHELGHAHQLGHVVDTNVVMHYSLSSGEEQRSLSSEDIMGSSDIQDRNVNESICGQLSMTNSSCFSASLGTDDYSLSDGLKIFPNPASDEVFIKNNASLNINRISLYNLEGRLVYNSISKNNNTLRRIEISNLSQGMYFIKVDTDYGLLTYKLMIK